MNNFMFTDFYFDGRDRLGNRLGNKLGNRLGDKENPIKVSGVRLRIIELMEQDARISTATIASRLGYSVTAIEKNIEFLKNNGMIKRHGATFGGYWEVIK